MPRSKGKCGKPAILKKKIIESRRLKKRIFPMLIKMIKTSSTKYYYDKVVEQFLIEETFEQDLYAAVTEQVLDPNKKIFEARRITFEESPKSVLTDGYDLSMLDDSDFWTYFHMTRRTIKIVQRDAKALLKEIIVTFHNTNISLESTIALSIWYLRSHKNRLEDAIKLFNMKSLEVVESALEYGLQAITKLREQCGLVWPTEDEIERTAISMEDRFKFPNVMGALTNKLFTSERGERILLQAVFNEKYKCKYAEISYNTNIRIAFRTAPSLMNLIDNLPERFCIMGDGAYNACNYWENINRIITPMEETDLGEEDRRAVKVFNVLQDSAMSIATNSLEEIIGRFPRLLNLHKSIPDAIIAACVLHNYCIVYRDEAPIF